MIKNEYQFSIPYYQYMDHHVTVDPQTPAEYLTKDFILAAYKNILHSRTLDEKAIKLQRTGLLGTYPGAIGQEAIGVGIANALSNNDILSGYYRDQAMQIMRGIKAEEILAYWGGFEIANHYEHADRNNDLPICVPIGTQCLHAVGVAYAQQYKKTNNVVISTIGDGGTSQGDFYEALNAAAHWKLPLVFIINNNQWAISISRKAQTAAQTLAQKAIAAGMPGIVVDGNDVIAVTEAVKLAVEKARSSQGPTLIEAQTFRLCDHTTADDASRYVPQKELEDAKLKDPVIRLKQYLQNHFNWSTADDEQLRQSLQQKVQTAAENYLSMPLEKPAATWDHLYENLPLAYQEQKQAWLKRQSSQQSRGDDHAS